ncbi:hypothetical protein KASHIRA_01850 [Serratia phage vB_SmaM-Kashira]|nr:hypothetical protein KASHIRA_01850 [Serratia phage vB_SmaM-Kashira]
MIHTDDTTYPEGVDLEAFNAENVRRKSKEAEDKLVPEVVKNAIHAAASKGHYSCIICTAGSVADPDEDGIDRDVSPYLTRAKNLISNLKDLGFEAHFGYRQAYERGGSIQYPVQIVVKW